MKALGRTDLTPASRLLCLNWVNFHIGRVDYTGSLEAVLPFLDSNDPLIQLDACRVFERTPEVALTKKTMDRRMSVYRKALRGNREIRIRCFTILGTGKTHESLSLLKEVFKDNRDGSMAFKALSQRRSAQRTRAGSDHVQEILNDLVKEGLATEDKDTVTWSLKEISSSLEVSADDGELESFSSNEILKLLSSAPDRGNAFATRPIRQPCLRQFEMR